MKSLKYLFEVSPKAPDRNRVRSYEKLISPLNLLAAILLVLSFAIYFPTSWWMIAGWVILAILYAGTIIYLREKRRRDHWLLSKKSIMLHSMIGIISIGIIEICAYINFGPQEVALGAIWILYFIPLSIVSRIGNTIHWWISLALTYIFIIVSFILGFFFSDFVFFSKTGFFLIISRALQVSFLALISASYHILVRQMREKEYLLMSIQESTRSLAKLPSFEASYESIARTIQSLFFPNETNVFILMGDRRRKKLRVVGAVGKDKKYWQNIELNYGQGITGKVFTDGKILNIRDVRDKRWSDVYFLAEGFENIRSEVAVPIEYQGEVIGILDVESPIIGEFDEQDEKILSSFAESLAISFGHFLSIDINVRKAYKLSLGIIEAGNNNTRFSDWFKDIAQLAHEHLDIAGLLFIRLAPGTAYPIPPGAVWPIELSSQNIIPKKIMSPDSVFWKILNEWELAAWGDFNDWDGWIAPEDRNIITKLDSNEIKSIIFLPVGSIEFPVGALFIGYKTEQNLGDVQRLSLISFAAALEKSYLTTAPMRHKMRRTGIAVHQVLVPATEKLFAQLSLIENQKGKFHPSSEAIDDIRYGIRALREQLKKVTVNDRYDLSKLELRQALKATASEFEELNPQNLHVSLDGIDFLEDEPLLMRQVYYDLITEAISNGVEHGNATEISVSVKVALMNIIVQIKDNGLGMPNTPAKNRPFGIFYLSRKFNRELNAKVDFLENVPRGTIVRFSVPVRPRITKDI